MGGINNVRVILVNKIKKNLVGGIITIVCGNNNSPLLIKDFELFKLLKDSWVFSREFVFG